MTKLRLGTRGSALARWQAEWVAARLRSCGFDVELVPISTRGDQQQHGPIAEIGTGVFTKEIQRALLDDTIDLTVHSLKDLPTEPVAGLRLSAVPERESTSDALVTRTGLPLADLPHGAIVGTGSHRRRAQLWHVRPDLRMEDIRGNVDTRLRKLDEGQYDGLVLAEAGLRRLGLADRIAHILPRDVMLPAVGQGALGIEARENDWATQQALASLDHTPTHLAVTAERSLLLSLRGGCLAPVGAWGRMTADGRLDLDAVVLSPDGSERLFFTGTADAIAAADLGRQVAEELRARGADKLIGGARGQGSGARG